MVVVKCTLVVRVDSFYESTEGKVRGGRVFVYVGLWFVWRRVVIGDLSYRSFVLIDSFVFVFGF